MNIKETLEKSSNLKVLLKIKDYKSTFISVLKTRSCLKISLHKLFVDSPEDIKKAVISYCLKRDKQSHMMIKTYAYKYFEKADYTHRLEIKKLKTNGVNFDLIQILDNLNLIYFKNLLNLSITWFEKPKYKKFRHVTYGSFDKSLKLVRINGVLDNSNFPFYFINYIVYHEMLHAMYPETISENGKRRIHTPFFKKKEQEFAYYKEAREFEKKFLKKRKSYGWT